MSALVAVKFFDGATRDVEIPTGTGPYVAGVKLTSGWRYRAYDDSAKAAATIAKFETLGKETRTGVVCNPDALAANPLPTPPAWARLGARA